MLPPDWQCRISRFYRTAHCGDQYVVAGFHLLKPDWSEISTSPGMSRLMAITPVRTSTRGAFNNAIGAVLSNRSGEVGCIPIQGDLYR